MVCLGRPYYFKSFKGCLSQILLGPFLNILTQIKQLTEWTHQNRHQLRGQLVGEISNCYDYFSRFSGFFYLFTQVF